MQKVKKRSVRRGEARTTKSLNRHRKNAHRGNKGAFYKRKEGGKSRDKNLSLADIYMLATLDICKGKKR